MDDAELRIAKRLCLFAHYHPTGQVADHVLLYLRGLKDAGFAVVVSSTATLSNIAQASLRAACDRLIVRENVGLDFGGWIDALRRLGEIEADLLLLANDSVYAPIHDLNAFIDRLTSAPADFYGAVESHEQGPHLQSWFLLFRPAAYRHAAFRRLMREPIDTTLPKPDIISRYEVGLTRDLVAAGLRYHAGYSPSRTGPIARRHPISPSHVLWKALIIDAGLPFLKVDILRNNPLHSHDIVECDGIVRNTNPLLADAIARDVAERSVVRGSGWYRLWRDTLYDWYPPHFPEVQGLLKRDYHRAGAGGTIDLALFRAVGMLGSGSRLVGRALRRWFR